MSEKELTIAIGQIVRRKRKAMKLSQTELANCVGLDNASFISSIERGHKNPSVIKLHELEQILGPIWRELP